MKFKKSIITTLLAVTLMISQTGCLIGIVAWPLWIVGSVVEVTGAALTTVGAIDLGLHRDQYRRDTDIALIGSGAGLMVLGAILDEHNPGRVDVLNPIPRDKAIADKMGVNVDDLSQYNNHLNQIRKVALELQKDIKSQVSRPELKKAGSLAALAQDIQVNTLVKKYGFENAEEFLKPTSTTKLPLRSLENFAEATHLTPVMAKIMLYHGFAVQTE
jgi:hypothetical protein